MDRRKKHWKRKRQDSSGSQLQQFAEETVQKVEPIFDKVFTYDAASGELQTENVFAEAPLWQDAELQTMKSHLNAIKSQLNEYEISVWHEHTSNMNPAGLIINTVKRAIKPELCTQAWCKFHEILNKFSLIKPNDRGELRTLHLCEAPGAFVTSLNHYLQSRDSRVRDWKWICNTLNPHNESNSQDTMIADDRFIQHTMPHWYFGQDNTGNIMSSANARGLIPEQDGAKFDLITADGSIDCSDNPSEQEKVTAKLHFCELVTALCCLQNDGNLVIKMFTLYEESSVSMMFIMKCAFEKLHVFKPASSKPGNSEVYVVAMGFKPLSQEVREKLLLYVNDQPLDKCILSEDAIPEDFKSQHQQCCVQFYNFQSKTIIKNRENYKAGLSDVAKKELENQRQCCAAMYIDKCRLSQISYQQRIVFHHFSGHKYNATSDPFYVCKKRQAGSYLERQEIKHLPRAEKLKRIPKFETGDIDGCFLGEIDLDHGRYEGKELHCENWHLVTGAKLESIKSSRFCSQELLDLYNDYLLEFGNITQNVQAETNPVKFKQDITNSLHGAISFKEINSPQQPGTSKEVRHTAEQTEAQNTHGQKTFDVVVCGTVGDLAEILSKSKADDCKLNFRIGDSENREGSGNPILLLIESPNNPTENLQGGENAEYLNAGSEIVYLLNKESQILVLKELQRLVYGDHVIFCLPMPLTRHSASVLFTMCSVFDCVRFFASPFANTASVYVHCAIFIKSHYTKFKTVIDKVLKYFEDNSQSCELEGAGSDVAAFDLLQFVPIKFLYSSKFYLGLSTVNDLLLKRRINEIIESIENHSALS